MALATVAFHIKPEHKQAAQEKSSQWFGNDREEKIKQKEVNQYLQILIMSILKREYQIKRLTRKQKLEIIKE